MGIGPAAVIKEENVMPCYLYQASYTGAAIKTLVGNPQDRTGAAKAAIEAYKAGITEVKALELDF